MTPHPANYGRQQRQLEQILSILIRRRRHFPDTWTRICDGITGQPRAQDTDPNSGPSSVLDDLGVPMPALSDPTGEANTRHDPARADLDEIRRLLSRMFRDAERFDAILKSHQARAANGYERMHTAENDPGCKSCARLEIHGAPRWEPVHRGVKINGEVVKLCSWCEAWARKKNEIPPRDVLAAHHDGKVIRERA